MNITTTKIKLAITLLSFIFIIIYLIFPYLKIDTIVLAFFVLSIIPWLSPIIKSVEIPGGTKLEFQDLKIIEEEAIKTGFIKTTETINKNKYSFLEIIDLDPYLALAGLRIELEKALKKLGSKNNIELGKYGMSYLIYEMTHKNIITEDEKIIINKLFGTLNKAVHGENFDERITQWTISIGTQILDSINEKSNK